MEGQVEENLIDKLLNPEQLDRLAPPECKTGKGANFTKKADYFDQLRRRKSTNSSGVCSVAEAPVLLDYLHQVRTAAVQEGTALFCLVQMIAVYRR